MIQHLNIKVILIIIIIIPSSVCCDAGFNFIWGGFSTSLQTRSSQQTNNSLTAARDLDGVIIPPGETFSFNKLVGARDSNKGYHAAPVITSAGILQDIPGGGICQLASTIYNAALLAGMTVVERHPHSRVISHVPPGRDATIASWRKDLKLKNPFSNPLQLRININQNRLVTSFRAPFEKPFTVELTSKRTRLEPDTVVLGGDHKHNLQKGATGFFTETRRIIRRNGLVSDELLSLDYYPALSRITK